MINGVQQRAGEDGISLFIAHNRGDDGDADLAERRDLFARGLGSVVPSGSTVARQEGTVLDQDNRLEDVWVVTGMTERKEHDKLVARLVAAKMQTAKHSWQANNQRTLLHVAQDDYPLTRLSTCVGILWVVACVAVIVVLVVLQARL
jgi:hypothetical protein